MPNLVYWTAVFFVRAFYWNGKFIGRENIRRGEASIFVANHAGAGGPIGCYCSFPFELHGWLQAEMADPQLAEDYLRVDFVERSLGLRTPASYRVARWLIKVVLPFLRAVNMIPVYRDYEDFQTTLHSTVDRLKAGHQVIIFPEDPSGPYDPVCRMAPFRKGMVRVAQLYFQETGQRVALYPVAVHPSQTIRVGRPIRYSPLARPSAERLRITHYLESAVRALYLQNEQGLPMDSPLPEG